MERRSFLKSGLVLGLAGAGAGAPAVLAELARPARSPAAPPLRLSANENPLGPSAAARRAIIDGLAEANRYPDAVRDRLVGAIAARHGVGRESVILGNGSTELLQMAAAAMASPNATLVRADPTFEAVSHYARPLSYRDEAVPLDDRFAHDIGRMRERAAAASGPVLVYLCNPNNPTGTLTPSDEIQDWVREAPDDTLFLIDEAYHDYVADPRYRTAVGLTAARRGLFVTRTFSKIHGLAGLRLGYGIAHPETAVRIRRHAAQDNANGAALAAALASLDDAAFVERSRESNSQARSILYEALDELGLERLPSHTNFVMHRVRGDLEAYIQRMAEHGVRVGRPFPPLLSYNRVSIGTPEEMGRFASILRDFRRRGWV